MRDIDVLFLVEHVDRELDAVTCLVHKLQERFKIMADVRNYYHDFEYSLKRYNPKVVVFPFFYGADHLYPIEYVSRWPTARFVNLAWEQMTLQTASVGEGAARPSRKKQCLPPLLDDQIQRFRGQSRCEPRPTLLDWQPCDEIL